MEFLGAKRDQIPGRANANKTRAVRSLPVQRPLSGGVTRMAASGMVPTQDAKLDVTVDDTRCFLTAPSTRAPSGRSALLAFFELPRGPLSCAIQTGP